MNFMIYFKIYFIGKMKIIKLKKLKNKTSRLISKEKLNITNKLIYNFGGWNLPNTIDYKLWGNIIFNISSKIIQVNDFSGKYYYKIFVNKDHNEVHLLNSNNNNLIIKFFDYPIDVSSFRRIINNQTYHFKNGLLILKTIKRSTNYLKSLKIDKKLNNNFITLDIETQTINNIMTPYCICFYDGKSSKSFYLSDYKDNQEMLLYAITSLLKRKYNGYKVYVHNLSNFDGIFILKILSSIDNIKLFPVIKDDKMIDIKLTYSNFSKYNISFRDSLLMLPSSLKK